jgi:hypothetical protein
MPPKTLPKNPPMNIEKDASKAYKKKIEETFSYTSKPWYRDLTEVEKMYVNFQAAGFHVKTFEHDADRSKFLSDFGKNRMEEVYNNRARKKLFEDLIAKPIKNIEPQPSRAQPSRATKRQKTAHSSAESSSSGSASVVSASTSESANAPKVGTGFRKKGMTYTSVKQEPPTEFVPQFQKKDRHILHHEDLSVDEIVKILPEYTQIHKLMTDLSDGVIKMAKKKSEKVSEVENERAKIWKNCPTESIWKNDLTTNGFHEIVTEAHCSIQKLHADFFTGDREGDPIDNGINILIFKKNITRR